MTRDEVTYFLSLAGFKYQALNDAINVCYCESSFNPSSHVNNSLEDSRGLMQINVRAHRDYEYLDLYDATINCRCAFLIFSQTNTFNAWKNCATKLGIYGKKYPVTDDSQIVINTIEPKLGNAIKKYSIPVLGISFLSILFFAIRK